MPKKKIKEQIESLKNSYLSLSEKRIGLLFNDLIKTCRDGNKIIVSALGKNVPICEKFTGTLTSLGIKAHFLHTNSAVHGDLGMIEKNDLVILLSKSGNTSETLYLAKLLKKRKNKTWLMTCNNKSKTSDYVSEILFLQISHEGDPWNLVPNNSTIIFLLVLQGLAMAMIDELSISIKEFKKNHPGGAIGKILKGV